MRFKLILLLVTLTLSGCAGQWIRVQDQEVVQQGDGYELKLPADWVKIQLGDTLVVTRDGPSLQKITVRAVPQAKAFPHLDKPASGKQLPSELADLFLADLRKEDQDQLPSLKVVSNEPASISGHDGFRVQAEYRTADGVRYDLIGYGFVAGERYYSIAFNAPTLYYFERDKGQFQQALASFKTD
jgi:hypothetical protein